MSHRYHGWSGQKFIYMEVIVEQLIYNKWSFKSLNLYEQK